MTTLVRLYIALVCICAVIVTLPFTLVGMAIEGTKDLFKPEEGE